MKTARFSDLVETAGRPSPHTIWVDPKDDPELQRAIKAERVLTVHQANVGQSKDYGTVGYEADQQAQFLIFPKSLKLFRDRRVVGINYDKVETPPIQRAKPKEKKTTKHAAPSRHEKTDTARKLLAKLTAEAESPVETAKEEKPAASAPTEAKKPEIKASSPEKVAVSAEAISSGEILKEIRAVLKALEGGKSVPAYRRLQELADQLEQSDSVASKKH